MKKLLASLLIGLLLIGFGSALTIKELSMFEFVESEWGQVRTTTQIYDITQPLRLDRLNCTIVPNEKWNNQYQVQIQSHWPMEIVLSSPAGAYAGLERIEMQWDEQQFKILITDYLTQHKIPYQNNGTTRFSCTIEVNPDQQDQLFFQR